MESAGSSHTFSEIFLHLNWHCLNDRPLIAPEIESFLHAFIREYCAKTKGVHFKGIGGTETHIHMVFQMEPFVLLSEFIGRIKGASSHEVNSRLGSGTLNWQRGYGAVSFSRDTLPLFWNMSPNRKNTTVLKTPSKCWSGMGKKGRAEANRKAALKRAP